MSVIEVNELWESRMAEATIDGQRRYMRSVRVFTDDVDTDGKAVLDDPRIPALRDPFPNDTGALVSSRTPTQLRSTPLIWEVEVDAKGDGVDDYHKIFRFVVKG